MTADRDREIFMQLVAGVPPERWEERLAELAGADDDLRRRVGRLLEAHRNTDSFLEAPAPGLEPTGDEPAAERPGTVIGPYKLIEQIGEGGFGVVFLAEQQQPVRRKVALKVLKPGMDSRQVVARFEAERQALALMEHPNIAKVLDAGTTAGGRPYFAMELVRGVPITEFCDQNKLTPRQRLQLFLPICAAVQHAHHKGIIHRDLKPSNVLVSRHDTTPVVKVIDFGVAKAVGQPLTDKTLVTGLAQFIGTPAYMSPEQAGLSGLDVDTRSNVYSLGVLLYELLTGTTPFDRERFRRAAYDEMRRIIREEEPPKPSIRVSTLGQDSGVVSANRQCDPKTLTRLFRGELDWVVMKCLEKDRDRRYDTPGSLARDVERYLADEPVQACPPSLWYRLRKLFRKHRGPALAACLVALALVAGIIGTSVGLVRADRAWQREEQQRQAAEANEKTAREREAETKAVLEFVEEKVFAAARPEDEDGGLGHDVSLRKAVETGLPFVDQAFKDQPLTEARLRSTLGWSFFCLGETKIAAEQFQRARDLNTLHLGPDHPDTLRSMNGLAICFNSQGRYGEALALHAQTLPLMKARLGADHPATLGCMDNLANDYSGLGRYAEALSLHEEAQILTKATFGPTNVETLGGMVNLALCYFEVGRTADALKLCEEALPLMQANIPRHRFTTNCLQLLARLYRALGRYEEACKLRQELLARRKANQGLNHQRTLETMEDLAQSLADLGRFTEGAKLREEAFALWKDKFGPEHLGTPKAMVGLAASYADLGRYGDALKLNEQALVLFRAKLDSDNPLTLHCMNNLALNYADCDRPADALKLQEQVLAGRKARLGPAHPDTVQTMENLANIYYFLRRFADACKLHEEVLALRKENLEPAHIDTLGGMVNLANSYRGLGRVADAVRVYEAALPAMRAKFPGHPFTANCMMGLAFAYDNQERHAEALKLHEAAVAHRHAHLGPRHPNTLGSLNTVAWQLVASPDVKLRDPKRAVELAREAVKLAPREGGIWNTLGVAYYRTGDHPAAVDALRKSMELSEGGDAADWLFLAMAQWRLGRKEEARSWYEKALAWVENNRPKDEELRRFCTEAAKVLGIPATASKPAK